MGYHEPTYEQGAALMRRGIEGPVVMLNLLQFREVADYSGAEEFAPGEPVSGAAAYDRYIAETMPFLRERGGEILFDGEGGAFLIGPEAERWDRALLVRHPSVAVLFGFASDAGYQAALAHRTAAVKDSRLLPLCEIGG